MKPEDQVQDDLLLFQAHFDQLLNEQHPLVKLAKQFDWDHFDKSIGERYCPDNGAPALPTRLMVGLHYLKHAFNESDESVVERWVENPASGGGNFFVATRTCNIACRSIPRA